MGSTCGNMWETTPVLLAFTPNGFPNDHTFFVGRFAGSSVGVLCAGQGGKPSHEKGVVVVFRE
jgi:hypothetical protein